MFAYRPYDFDFDYEQERRARAAQLHRQRLAEHHYRQAQLQKQQELQARREQFVREQYLRQRQVHRQHVGYDFFGRPVYRRQEPSPQPDHPVQIPINFSSSAPHQASSHAAEAAEQVSNARQEAKRLAQAAAKAEASRKQEQQIAAQKIQSAWRQSTLLRKTLSQLAPVQEAFASVTSLMSFPATAQFDQAGNFTYASINVPIHHYVDELEKLLLRLDSVESNGFKRVKEARKSLVKAIEAELERVEAWKALVLAEQQSAVKVNVESNAAQVERPALQTIQESTIDQAKDKDSTMDQAKDKDSTMDQANVIDSDDQTAKDVAQEEQSQPAESVTPDAFLEADTLELAVPDETAEEYVML